MAIYNAVPPPEELTTSGPIASPSTPVTNGAIDIDAWTISALQSLSVSPVARGTGTPLVIPIDVDTPSASHRAPAVAFDAPADENALPRRPPSRRDSMKRREALLRGNEGSRQRRRWENDRLVGVPNVQPPLPTDWEVRPTHRVCRVPYQVAQFWDHGIRQQVEEKTARLQAARKKQQRKCGSATGLGVGEIPRDLRETAKRTPAVRDWVRVLEEPVRHFLLLPRGDEQQQDRPQPPPPIVPQDRAAAAAGDVSGESDLDSDDEEIVFVGRNGAMRELRDKKEARYRRARREISHETVDSGLVFDSFGDGESAAFKSVSFLVWLPHRLSRHFTL
ncbi:hypothetical protein AAL_01537 [Moelleriella libera RCEF 2490]|uniref:R3H-associated N-terminal domain-containing protein n=1 Tax=Moelleriella libera RCEF 2490 TaxID=1081109 RepID=A0A166RK87_9HYPO|nr:hypothetical protein AAL_01537 [Moelleriella libera RCEF 2490]